MTFQVVKTDSSVAGFEALATKKSSNSALQQEQALGQAARTVKNNLKNTIALEILETVTTENATQILTDLKNAKDIEPISRPTTVREILSSKSDSEFGRLAKVELFEALTSKGIKEDSSLEDIKKALEEIRGNARKQVKLVNNYVRNKTEVKGEIEDTGIIKEFGRTANDVISTSLRYLKEGLPSEKFQELSITLDKITDPNVKAATSIGLVCRYDIVDSKDAFILSNRALELDPNNSIALHILGVCYYKGLGVTKDYSKAVECYNKAIKADPTNAEALNNLGICYQKGFGVEKNIPEAMRLYEAAYRKDPQAVYSENYESAQREP